MAWCNGWCTEKDRADRAERRARELEGELEGARRKGRQLHRELDEMRDDKDRAQSAREQLDGLLDEALAALRDDTLQLHREAGMDDSADRIEGARPHR